MAGPLWPLWRGPGPAPPSRFLREAPATDPAGRCLPMMTVPTQTGRTVARVARTTASAALRPVPARFRHVREVYFGEEVLELVIM
ncbi:hypothetical protein JYU34_003044 [Plutella xylostella]|uniref:Uncharacterized protein n=1 Tax=Plutella xylostella TaxID=51655 RepID=A0ABQ7QZ40_PLUXY|nr:hypothetical protein JYU34_003044 [Plutella xylostella]